MELKIDQLKHKLHYDPESGIWTWLNPPNHNSRLKGQHAGNRRYDGYLIIRIKGRNYYSGRLAWFYMTGEWPKDEIDHVDRDPSNDCWANLREATSSQNKFNRTYKGLRGVYRKGKKWMVLVGQSSYLCLFDSLEEACAVRDAEAKRLGGDFAILNNYEECHDS